MKNINTLRGSAIAYFVADEKAQAVVPAYAAGLKKAIHPEFATIWTMPRGELTDEQKLVVEAVAQEREAFVNGFVEAYTGSAKDPRANARNYWKRVIAAGQPPKPKGAKSTEARALPQRVLEDVGPIIKAYYREDSDEYASMNKYLELAFAEAGGDLAKLKGE
jgi:hypothetical protein